MIKNIEVRKPIYSVLPANSEGFESLAELALDLRWSWNHAGDEIWNVLDPALWELTHNPWVVLQTASRDRFQEVMKDSAFRNKVDLLVKANRDSYAAPTWFQKNHPDVPLTAVAYFSMEFMLSEALPIYSGGLGNVAGDQLKAASDLGIPVIGIGLLFQQGYFRQEIDLNGAQQAIYPYNDPGQLPITPLRQANGEWLRLEIALPCHSLWLRVWQVQVGRIKLYLLDSNDAANFAIHRGITAELYGGGPELRLKQEMVLGIGGWRLLHALGNQPQVCHLNEGHAAFAILERAYNFMIENNQPFYAALSATRAGNLFTTHTAVSAGFDCFDPSLIEQYLGKYAREKLGITVQQLLALGRHDQKDESEKFNMAYLAFRGSGAVNGVSRLHGEVCRHIFGPLFLHWPEKEVPVAHITNGIHTPSWDSMEADELWTELCGKDRWLGMNENLEQNIRTVSDEKLWELRNKANKKLINFANEHFSRHLLGSGHSFESVENAKHHFDPNILTLGFARRFASYKRPNLLLHDPDRLMRILTNSSSPVQLILSGKAHPADQEGQNLIREWIKFIRLKGNHPPVIFLADYDMYVSENLVQGVDVWINTPRRPWEASGTSGMKVLVNGGLNLSELDGWWAEAYNPKVGWALGDGKEHEDESAWDRIEAEQLYNILEQQVIPEFYKRNEKGIPVEWVSRMRESMAQLTPKFSADRAVREYTEQHYLPAAESFIKRSANKGEPGKQIADWHESLKLNWPGIHFGDLTVHMENKDLVFKVRVFLHDLDPASVRVEMYANGIDQSEPVRHEMKLIGPETEKSVMYLYSTTFESTRPSSDYTARIIPEFKNVEVPLEAPQIMWQR